MPGAGLRRRVVTKDGGMEMCIMRLIGKFLIVLFRAWAALAAENPALPQQLNVVQRSVSQE